MTALVWVEWSRDFWRSGDGRFDVIACADAPGWFRAFDWERGRRSERARLDEAKAWCLRKLRYGHCAPSAAV